MSHSAAAGLALALAALAACQPRATAPAPHKTMSAFAGDAELREFVERGAQRRGDAAPPAQQPADADAVTVTVAGPAPGPRAGSADDGGIVKEHGKHLVVLRRDRLFSVDIGKDQARDLLRPVSAIDAFAPGTAPDPGAHEEMLIAADTVAVIGYNGERGGIEIGLFDIGPAGRLGYRATYHLRSTDPHAASRQVGGKLVFYTPLALDLERPDPLAALPALRKWRAGASADEFARIAPATRIYHADAPLEPLGGLTLHTVTVCDPATREMRCEASAVLGPQGRVVHMAADSVYVWSMPYQDTAQAGLFRIPFDGGAPRAVRVTGAPLDHFSFLEGADHQLNVLVAGSVHAGLALLRVAPEQFSDGGDSVPADHYRPLPPVDAKALTSRYVGPWLLYGTTGGTERAPLHALRWDRAGTVQRLPLAHPAERIEAMGEHAVVIGAAGADLHFTSVRLGQLAALAKTYVRADAAQGDARGQGFFYKPERPGQGMVGVPLVEAAAPGEQQHPGGGASVLYLRNTALKLRELGALQAQPAKRADADCGADCGDWYANITPLFLQGRVFALIGDELVEGKLKGGRMREARRIGFAPAPLHAEARQ